MIQDKEIKEKAAEFKINPPDVEKDYVYGWILNGIYSQSRLGPRLILKGGNALRKAYLPDTRFSKDLDFSIEKAIAPGFLQEELNKVCTFVRRETGIMFDLNRTRVKLKSIPAAENKIVEARAYFKGFYGEENIILKAQLDVTQFDRIYLPIQARKLIHPYSDGEKCITELKCQKAEEILASKLNTLLHRRKVVDLFDLLYSILFNKDFSLLRREVIVIFLRKSIYESRPIIAKRQLLGVPLEEYRSDWNTLVVPARSIFSFEQVADNFRSLIDTLFGLLPAPVSIPAPSPTRTTPHSRMRPLPGYVAPVAPHCFSLGTREEIIKAGRSQTLLELVYDSYKRLVEPYSFTYRIRKSDNRGVEYFFGFDRSGGKSGKQGIKCFICDKIESVRSTSTHYDPRWPIEM